MANKAQILVNEQDGRQSTAPNGPDKAMDSHNAVKQGFPASKCVISTQNQADFIYLIMQNKPNFRMTQINSNVFISRIYENKSYLRTKEKQSQSNPISKFHPSQRSRKRKREPGEKGKIVGNTY